MRGHHDRSLPELTAERRQVLEEFRPQWEAVLYSTARADREAAEAGVRCAYEVAGLAPPKICMWFDSPLAALIAAEIVAGRMGVNEVLQAPTDTDVDPRRVLLQLQAAGAQIGDRRDPVAPGMLDKAKQRNSFEKGSWVNADRFRYLWMSRPVPWLYIVHQAREHAKTLCQNNIVWKTVRDQQFSLFKDSADYRVTEWVALSKLGVGLHDIDGLIQVTRETSWWTAFDDVAILAEHPSAVGGSPQDGLIVTFADGFTAQGPAQLLGTTPRRRTTAKSGRPAGGLKILTKERQDALNEFAHQWRTDRTAGAPADRPRVEDAIRRAYRAEGLQPPQAILWFDSPLAGALAQSILWMHGHNIRSSWKKSLQRADKAISKQCYEKFRTKVHEYFDDPGPNIWDVERIRDETITAALRENITGAQWRGVQESWPTIFEHALAAAHAHLGAAAGHCHRANIHTAYWDGPRAQGRWDPLAESATLAALGVKTPSVRGLLEVARSAGWWWALDTVAVVTEPAQLVATDEQGRTHHETGPAIRYRDGYSVYAWHGVNVPADLIETGWTAQQIMDEPNVEIRRCAVERIGWDVFLAQLGAEPIASAPDPGNPGHMLYLYEPPEALVTDGLAQGGRTVRIRTRAQRSRVLMCTNGSVERDGTRRRYGLMVPAHHVDPVAAAAELYGVSVEVYRKLEVRR